jgi:hypothetical protein
MPGYGYSGQPRETGWGPDRVARAWQEPALFTAEVGAAFRSLR